MFFFVENLRVELEVVQKNQLRRNGLGFFLLSVVLLGFLRVECASLLGFSVIP